MNGFMELFLFPSKLGGMICHVAKTFVYLCICIEGSKQTNHGLIPKDVVETVSEVRLPSILQ